MPSTSAPLVPTVPLPLLDAPVGSSIAFDEAAHQVDPPAGKPGGYAAAAETAL